MDIRCPICGEPWDHDSLHEFADELETTYEGLSARFRREGCAAFMTSHNTTTVRDDGTPEIISAIYEIMGDDMDGAASAFDDAEFLGVI